MNIIDNTIDTNELVNITQEELLSFWKEHIPLEGFTALEAEQIFEKAFLEYAHKGEVNSEMAFMNGGWTFNLKAGLVKTAFGGATMAGIFYFIGFTSISVTVLPSVLPFLFELDKIELSKKDEYILAKLLVREEIKTNTHDASTLYNLLPNDIKKQLNKLDFQDFLEQLDLAGYLKQKGENMKILEKQRFKITFI